MLFMVFSQKFSTNKNFLVEILSEWIHFRYILTGGKADDVRMKGFTILAWGQMWADRADFCKEENYGLVSQRF